MGKKIRKCNICGRNFTEITKHWQQYHSDVSQDLFLAKMNGLEEIPKCPYCGKDLEYDWSKQHFFRSCRNAECQSKHRSYNRKKTWSDPDFKREMCQKKRDYWDSHPERKLELSQKLYDIYQDPKVRKKVSEGVLRAYQEIPDMREKVALASKRHWQDAEYALRVKTAINESLKDNFQYLYLFGFWDTWTEKFCTKCGTSVDWFRRLQEYQDMGYEFKRGFIVFGKFLDMLELEYDVHGYGFEKLYMDFRNVGKMSNGPTEWYQPSEFKKIRNYLRDELNQELEEISE